MTIKVICLAVAKRVTMKTMIRLAFMVSTLVPISIYSQHRGVRLNQEEEQPERRFALVIGNGAYKLVAPLKNPPRDADAMARALKSLGFEVMSKVNMNKKEMREAIKQFGDDIRGSGVGLFYYAGHGIQSNGRNYLVPVNADITSEGDIEDEAGSVDQILSRMEDARNRMNIVILDACRNNPFSSLRSVSRGLGLVVAPTGTFIAYATSPGSVAEDGEGANGIYTQALLKEIHAPGVQLEDVFKKVLSDVRNQTGGRQVPWISSSVEGKFYFNASVIESNTEAKVTSHLAGESKVKEPSIDTTGLWLQDIEARSSKQGITEDKTTTDDNEPINVNEAKLKSMSDDFARVRELAKKLPDEHDKVEAWSRFLERYKNWVSEDKRAEDLRKEAKANLAVHVDLAYNPPSTDMEFILVQPGSFQMGSSDGDKDEKPIHSVTIRRPFYIGKEEVTQEQWRAVMGNNPSSSKGDSRPVDNVSWERVQEFIRILNEKEMTNKYRLPTEAEWEFAARGGTKSGGYGFSGSNVINDVAVCARNSGGTSKPAGSKQPNELGIYDMSGNVEEWCQDWYGPYKDTKVTDPTGPPSGQLKVLRGGANDDQDRYCRTTCRNKRLPNASLNCEGFRLVKEVE